MGRRSGRKFEPQKLPNEYALAVHELVQAKIEQRAPEVEIETEKRDRVGASTVLHFGNVNYRHMPRTRLTFGTGSEVLSGCRNQPTVPADGDPACVPAGRVSLGEVFLTVSPRFSKNDPRAAH